MTSKLQADRPTKAHVEINEVLRFDAILRDAMEYGAKQGTAGNDDDMERSAWLRRGLPEWTRQIPGILGSHARARGAAIGALQAAIEVGYNTAAMERQARTQHGQPPWVPTAAWLRGEVAGLIAAFWTALALGDLDTVNETLAQLDSAHANPVFDVVTDEGIHRIRSHYFTDDDSRSYQLLVVRDGIDVTVYRRYCGAIGSIPVCGGFSVPEMAFLSVAFERIREELTPLRTTL